MARIDFHSNVSDQLDYACRLTRKALAAGCRLVVRHDSEQQLAEFDRLLWSFSDVDFLPHVSVHDPLAAVTPVLQSLEGDSASAADFAHHEILLNLSVGIPADFSRYERLIEIVPPAALEAGRARYRYYQQQCYPLTHITAK